MAANKRPRAPVVAGLGIAQTLAWGSTYYLPAIFAGPVSAELDLSPNWFFGLFSLALLLSGVLGPWAGRLIDRRGGRGVLAASSVTFAIGLTLLALAQNFAGLAAAWLALGFGMGFGLYEAAFATVTRIYGREARSAITGITLFAGFASTLGWPLSAFLIDALGWRGGCLAWALLHLLVCLPLYALLTPAAPPLEAAPVAAARDGGGASPLMAILALAFGAGWFVSTAFAAHLPRLLGEAGLSPGAAVFAAGLVGPAQVAARLAEFSLLQKTSPLFTARLATALHPVGALLMLGFGASFAVPFVLLHGGGNGLLTIARGTLPLALFGPAGYGLRIGLISAPARISQGAAPLLFGYALDRGGAYWAISLAGALMGLAFLAMAALRQPRTEAAAP